MEKSFTIETLLADDLKYISGLTPAGWYDVTPLYEMHLNQDYFFPIKSYPVSGTFPLNGLS